MSINQSLVALVWDNNCGIGCIMKKIIFTIGVLLAITFSSHSQGYVYFNSLGNSTKISTNLAQGDPPNGLTSGIGGQYRYALYYSTTATSVNGYAFNDPAWKLAAYGTNTTTAGGFLSTSQGVSGTQIPDVPGLATARFVIVGWSTNCGITIPQVSNWYGLGDPYYDSWLGQSAVSGALTLGDGIFIPGPSVMGPSSSGLIPGFTLGRMSSWASPPSFSNQPTNQTVPTGGSASFTVSASGWFYLPITGRWRLNGTNLNAGQKFSMISTSCLATVSQNGIQNRFQRGVFTLIVSNIQADLAGNYSLAVSNSSNYSGINTSFDAVLTVLPPAVLVSHKNESDVELSWPIASGAFSVQSAANITGPWSDLNLNITTIETNYFATVPITDGQQFYRLKGN